MQGKITGKSSAVLFNANLLKKAEIELCQLK